jgi:nucleoside-diphosphate-sugar epimerase
MTGGRVLVTGANGFAGRGVWPRLAAAGWPLTLAVRDPAGLAGAPARVVRAPDLGPDADWREALEGAWAVVHLAGRAHQLRDDAADPEAAFMTANRDGAAALARQAAGAGVRHFLLVSTAHVLGTSSAPGRPLRDGDAPAPGSAYARSKLAGEAAAREVFAREGRALVVLRPPLLVGPGLKGNLERLERLARLPVPLPLGGLRNRRTLLSVDGLGEAIETVLERWRSGPATGAYLVGDAEPVSTSDMVAAMRRGMGRAPALLPAPAALARRALRLAGREALAERLFGDLELDASGFRAAFGWRPSVSGLEALERAVSRPR